jgi:sugar phosphate permease
VHGFFPDVSSAGNRLLWSLTLLAIGVTAAVMLALAAHLALGRARGRRAASLTGALWVAYALVVVSGYREFYVAIAAYLPAMLLLMAALAKRWLQRRTLGVSAGLAGMLLALVGAAGQQAGIGLHPVYFDHNAVYHVVQAFALYLLYRCGIELIDTGDGAQTWLRRPRSRGYGAR